MTPAERIPLLLRLTDALTAIDGVRKVELYLREFGFNLTSFEYWQGDLAGYVQSTLQDGIDGQLISLAEFLFGEGLQADPDPTCWRPGEFKLFLSHIAQRKEFVITLADALKLYGVHGFVAHEDIEPGQHWVTVIDEALMSCDALVAVLHPGFHESKWTDQEVGYVMGRGKFSVAIRAGLDPYGFLGLVQGIPGEQGRNSYEMAREIVKVLTSERRTMYLMQDALVNRLISSESFDMSNDLVDLLRQCPGLTKDHYLRLRDAQRTNSQVGRAHQVPGLLNPLADEYGRP